MLCAVVAATLVAALAYRGSNLTTIGIISAGLPQMTLPPLSLTLWLELLPAALCALPLFLM